MPEPKTIYLQLPLPEFEYLHQEIVRLRAGWSDAEGQIAALQADRTDLIVKLSIWRSAALGNMSLEEVKQALGDDALDA